MGKPLSPSWGCRSCRDLFSNISNLFDQSAIRDWSVLRRAHSNKLPLKASWGRLVERIQRNSVLEPVAATCPERWQRLWCLLLIIQIATIAYERRNLEKCQLSLNCSPVLTPGWTMLMSHTITSQEQGRRDIVFVPLDRVGIVLIIVGLAELAIGTFM